MPESSIPIAIVDDHTLFREGVSTLMKEFKEIDVVFEASNGEQMIQMIRLQQKLPKVILMDINMPVMNGYESVIWLKSNFPQIHVLALSMFEDEKAIMKMIKSGANGYILKRSRPQEVFEAINLILQKGFYINELVSGKMVRSLGSDEEVKLTDKEISFLKHCCSELTYKEIAIRLNVSPRTVDNYRESLFIKLNIKSRTGLVLYAIRNDISS